MAGSINPSTSATDQRAATRARTNNASTSAPRRGFNDAALRFDPAHTPSIVQTRLRALATWVDLAARDFSTSLTALVRTTVGFQITRVEQLQHGKLTDRLAAPHCVQTLVSAQLDSCAVVFEAAVLYPIIDRMLGGGSEPTPILRRPFTDIELHLAARIAQMFGDALRQTSSGIAAFEFVVARADNVASAAVAPSRHAPVVAIDVELTVGEAVASMRLTMPVQALDQWDRQFARWLAGGATAANEGQPVDPHRPASRELVVELARTQLSADDLANLRVGDIITTDQDVQAPLTVTIAGEAKFQAHPGAHAGHRAARIV